MQISALAELEKEKSPIFPYNPGQQHVLFWRIFCSAKNRAFRSKSSEAAFGASCGLSVAIACAPGAVILRFDRGIYA